MCHFSKLILKFVFLEIQKYLNNLNMFFVLILLKHNEILKIE